MKTIFKRISAIIIVAAMLISSQSFGSVSVKANSVTITPFFTTGNRMLIDLNANDGRKDSYTPQAYNWVITGTSPTVTYNGVAFTLSREGSAGSGIRVVNYKGLTQSDGTTPTLTMDGVTVNGADKGGKIRLEITGLSNGTHTITTYHSYADNWSNGSPVTVSVNGTKSSTISVPTRVRNDYDAGVYHTSFTASGKVTVIIEPTDSSKNGATLNAFEIDGGDPIRGASRRLPKDGDRHHELSKGLSWKAGTGATSYDVYIGKSYNSVFNATTSSAEFKRNQTGTTYPLDNSYNTIDTYYWRVDTKNSGGTLKGSVQCFQVARLAFPSAEGYGRFARGGRGGRIIEVTNLNDSGAGSLRNAIENEKGARIIVFRVGGVIQLNSRLVIPSDGGDVYVAGQTAPGDGITLTRYDFGVMGASDVIIRHIRVRPGDHCNDSIGAMGLASADHCIIDRCTMSWATDEGFSSRSSKNITFQWNIIAETLNDSVHHMGKPHSFAASIGGNIGSFHHNLLINNTGRNWSLAGGMEQDAVTYGGALDIRNNVVYNWQNRTTDGGVRRLNFVNNYYKAGAVSRTNMHMVSIDGNELGTNDMQKMYVSGNKMVAANGSVVLAHTADAWAAGSNGGAVAGQWGTVSTVRSTTPFFESYVNTQTADAAYSSVINATTGAGAGTGTAQGRDYLDTRYIKEVKDGTFTYRGSKQNLQGIIDSQRDVGGYPTSSNFKGGTAPTDTDKDGMPDAWEIKHGLNPNNSADGNLMTLSADGYTNVEMYLNELAGDTVVFNGKPVVIPDLNGTLIKNLKRLDQANYSNWSIQNNLKNGDVIYGDRTNTFTSIPAELAGAEWIKTAADSKELQSNVATFTAGGNITAYIGLDSRVVPANLSWLNGWTKTSMTATASNDVTYNIYQRNFSSGATVTLGSNGAPSGVIMYTVFVKAQSAAQTTTPATTTTAAATTTPPITTTAATTTTAKSAELLNGILIKNLDIKDTVRSEFWSIQNKLKNGDVIYGDRTNTFTEIPAELAGAEWIKLSADSKAFTENVATFTAGADITAYIGLDSRVVPANVPWLNGWTKTNMTVTASNDVTYDIYQRNFASGTTVTLGSNGPTASVIMYTVSVKAQSAAQTTADNIATSDNTSTSDSTAISDSTTTANSTTATGNTTTPDSTKTTGNMTTSDNTTVSSSETTSSNSTTSSGAATSDNTTTHSTTTVENTTSTPNNTTVSDNVTSSDNTTNTTSIQTATAFNSTTTTQTATTPSNTTTPNTTLISDTTTTPNGTSTSENTTTCDSTTTSDNTTTSDITTTSDNITTSDNTTVSDNTTTYEPVTATPEITTEPITTTTTTEPLPDCDCDKADCEICSENGKLFALGNVDGKDGVTIFDALEILKELVGMESLAKDNPAALITGEAQLSGMPTIFDALEILKYLVSMGSGIDGIHIHGIPTL